jgi:hypothetical protein
VVQQKAKHPVIFIESAVQAIEWNVHGGLPQGFPNLQDTQLRDYSTMLSDLFFAQQEEDRVAQPVREQRNRKCENQYCLKHQPCDPA